MAEKEEKNTSEAAQTESKNDEEMWKIEGYDGKVMYFKKPKEPDLIDVLDQEKWGSDEEEILPSDYEESEDEDQPPAEPPPQIPETATEEERILELAKWDDRQRAELEYRKKLKRVKKKEEIIKKRLENEVEEEWNFPIDPENWTEEDLGEEWCYAPPNDYSSGFDPDLMPPPEPQDLEKVKAMIRKRTRRQKKAFKKHMEKLKAERMKILENPPDKYDPELFRPPEKQESKYGLKVRPYYVPYYRPFPMVPKIHPEVETAMDTLEELEKIEEFLQWASYIFADGSSYEGTVWDDLAHGKGVYRDLYGHVEYEGMWLQNMMEGHGVLHVHVPVYQPPPDSKLEKKMRAEGWVLKADLMNPEEREWLKKDVEDTLAKSDVRIDKTELFENDPFWLDLYGKLPEKGRYKYSGQWKHNRMHGCGVLDVNTRLVYGKFYFGELLPEEEECSLEACAVHSGIAQVAAAKARMFTKKPDGMVRMMEGPFCDPEHPYMYEEEDMWMAPGWVNAYYEVPDEWKIYVEDVDKEQEMWLNSFIKSPLRIPMPAELEYMWENGEEFIMLGHEPSIYGWLDMENVLKSHPDLQGEILYHVPTGRLLNWIEDEDGNPRFFWQPISKDGTFNPEDVEFLPDGWDEFFSDEPVGEDAEKKKRELLSDEEWEKKCREEDERIKQELDRKNAEAKRTWREQLAGLKEKLKLIAQAEKETVEAELRELDAIEAMRKAQKEARKKAAAEKKTVRRAEEEEDKMAESKAVREKGEEEEDTKPPSFGKVVAEKVTDEEDEEDIDDKKPKSFGKVAGAPSFGKVKGPDEEDDDDEDNDEKPSSFGTVAAVERNDDAKAGRGFPSAFAAMTLSPRFFKGLSLLKAAREVPVVTTSSTEGVSRGCMLVRECVNFKCVNRRHFVKLRAVAPRVARAVFQGKKRNKVGGCRKQPCKTSERHELLSIAIPVHAF